MTWSNFNILPKTNQTSMTKCLAEFLWTFKIACSNFGLPKILWENADFGFLMKAQVVRNRVNLHKSFCMNYVRESVGNSLQYSI